MKIDNSKQRFTKVVFPKPGTYFHRLMTHKGTELPRSYKWFRRLNKYIMVPLYRLHILPLIRVGRLGLLMITTRGRKTGKTRRNPLEYHRINGIIHIVAARGNKTDWVRNIRANPDNVQVQVGFKKFIPRIEILEDIPSTIGFIEWMVKNIPGEAKIGFGWNPKEDDINCSNFTPLAELLTVIRLHEPTKE
jgi:hypothetical protein